MGKFKKLKNKISKGSILVFSLIILSIILVSALGIASVTTIERKNAGSTGKSTQSFQVADSGVEVVMKKIITDGYKSVNDLDTLGSMTCAVSGGLAVISGNLGSTDKTYQLTFKDVADTNITTCGNTNQIGSIKAVGSYLGTTRAIEAAVAATPANCVTAEVANTAVAGKGCAQVNLALNGEPNICADGDGCLIKGVINYNGLTEASPFDTYCTQLLYQSTSNNMITGTNSRGTNGDASATQISDLCGGHNTGLWDDSAGTIPCEGVFTENSANSLTLGTEAAATNHAKIIICD